MAAERRIQVVGVEVLNVAGQSVIVPSGTGAPAPAHVIE
jgi:hypothetical protein